MKKSKCPKVYSIEGTIESHEEQIALTFFPNVLNTFFGDGEGMEERLIELEDPDIEYNIQQKVVTVLIKHEVF